MPEERSAGAREPSGKVPPGPNRAGRFIFAGVFLAVSLGIAAAVLFSNDMRNLRLLFQRFDLEWPPNGAPLEQVPPETAVLRPPEAPGVELPRQVFSPPPIDSLGGFLREMRQAGPAFCAALNEAGLPNEGWLASPFDGNTHECLSETFYGPEPVDDTAVRASVFVIVKGSEDGSIDSIRMKLVAPDGEPGAQARDALLKGVELLIARTGWSDLAAIRESVLNHEDFATRSFGQSFSFTREFTSPDRFNLIILPSDRDPAVQRARSFFDDRRWLPLPSAGVDTPYPFPAPLGRAGP